VTLQSLDDYDFLFDIWHRFRLFHRRLPFATLEARKRNVVRARPPQCDNQGDIIRPGTFDTVLFLHSPEEFGIHREYFPLETFS
jgi:hypothetical protein